MNETKCLTHVALKIFMKNLLPHSKILQTVQPTLFLYIKKQ